ncbi:hypothetical protein M9H77_35177 [Catharanthus roseus]|uniref:Uncharacterized protein n=1 Tax=Catharanthus roseus TaxID=4058 RepID=A0ACB9ZSJ3_CATRO|nr:hypothetical protein M9H77_35177 [Catharanthus roseus]
MKIHPVATKRSISIRDGFEPSSMNNTAGNSSKKLRKLPHVFSNVLELPFRSDADVEVEDTPEIIRFVAKIDLGGDVDVDGLRAHAVEIHPGVTKIVVRNNRGGGDVGELLLEQLKVDTWRFRLPRVTQPELATAVFEDGELIVTVPKGGGGQIDIDGGRNWGAPGNLVLVR